MDNSILLNLRKRTKKGVMNTNLDSMMDKLSMQDDIYIIDLDEYQSLQESDENQTLSVINQEEESLMSSEQQQTFTDSCSSQQDQVQQIHEQEHMLSKEFFDELIIEIDQFEKLYYLSKTQNCHRQKQYYKLKTQNQPISTKVIKISTIKNQNTSLNNSKLKTIGKKQKKIPQIYHPQLQQIKMFYFQLKRLYIVSVLKNTYIVDNFQPNKMSQLTFKKQVDIFLKIHRVKSESTPLFQSNGHNKISCLPKKIYIKKIKIPLKSSEVQQNTFDLTQEQIESQFELIRIQEISFNPQGKNFFKNNCQFSLSTTIDLIEEQND